MGGEYGNACFNPRPPLLAGDAHRLPRLAAPPARFNPRPPLLAGDAQHLEGLFSLGIVSIRARHCWRAMPAATEFGNKISTVSIRARHCWRAMPLTKVEQS